MNQLVQAIQALQAAGLLNVGAVVSTGKGKRRSAPKASKADTLTAKDASTLATFKRRGFADIQLAPRGADGKVDLTQPHNVKSFQTWLSQGRVVRKGQKSVKGMFHITQTDPVPAVAS